MNVKPKGIILTAAKADITICDAFGYMPTGLIPVNGKPIIYYIIKQFYDSGINDITIGVNYKSSKVKSIVSLYFSSSIKINYVKTSKNGKPGSSLLKIFHTMHKGSVVVNLADTYIKGLRLDKIKDALVVSDNYTDGRRWSSVILDRRDNIVKFMNKKKLNKNKFVLSGVYGFQDISVFKNYDDESDDTEITDLCQFYIKNAFPLKVFKTEDWMDFGHIDRYQISKKRLIESREFNHLEFDHWNLSQILLF